MVRSSNLLPGSYSHFLNSFFAFILSSLSSVLCMFAFAFFSAWKSTGLPTLPILCFLTGSPPFRGLCRPSSKACPDHATENPQQVIRVPVPFGCVESSTAHAPHTPSWPGKCHVRLRTCSEARPVPGELLVLAVVAGVLPAWRWREAPELLSHCLSLS